MYNCPGELLHLLKNCCFVRYSPVGFVNVSPIGYWLFGSPLLGQQLQKPGNQTCIAHSRKIVTTWFYCCSELGRGWGWKSPSALLVSRERGSQPPDAC